MKIEVSKYACMFLTSGVQVRTSRKKRINKKYRKKYGWKSAKCYGQAAWNVGGVLVCCPCVYAKLTKVF